MREDRLAHRLADEIELGFGGRYAVALQMLDEVQTGHARDYMAIIGLVFLGNEQFERLLGFEDLHGIRESPGSEAAAVPSHGGVFLEVSAIVILGHDDTGLPARNNSSLGSTVRCLSALKMVSN